MLIVKTITPGSPVEKGQSLAGVIALMFLSIFTTAQDGRRQLGVQQETRDYVVVY